MFECAPPDVTEAILDVACTIPALVSSLLGAGSVCKEARRAYHARKTPLDGSVRHVEGDWFLLHGGMSFEERETEAESLSDPFSIRIVRENKPGRPILVFLVLDEQAKPGVGMVVRASRVSARNFVSIFSSKDVHRQVWKAVHLGRPCLTGRRSRMNALPMPLPLADKEMCVWPLVFPETRHHPERGVFEITGNVAVHVPVDVESHPGLPSDPENCPAVFGRDLLDVAGFGEPPCTLNRVPGVLSVDTPTEHVFDSPAHTDKGRDLRVRYFMERSARPSSALVRLDPPPKRAAAEGAARLIANHANLINATSASGAMPLGLKSQVVEEFEAQHGVSDARFADVEETSDCDEGDRHDSDYKPGGSLKRDGSRRALRRRRC